MFIGKGTTKCLSLCLTVIFFLTGCASGRYIAKPVDSPPDLEIASKDDRLAISLNSLILPNGTGAWVEDARWDEYVVTVRNISDKALTIEKVRLIDPRGLYIESGVDPSQLETLSEALANEYKDAGIMVAAYAVPTAVGVLAIGAGAVGTAVVATALLPVAAIGGAAWYFGKKYTDAKDKEDIQREFMRKRLSTFTLSGNATIKGSAFFPIIPNPKALVVDYRLGSDMKVLEIPLDKLNGLHVATAEGGGK